MQINSSNFIVPIIDKIPDSVLSGIDILLLKFADPSKKGELL